jgi:hypothetical protein
LTLYQLTNHDIFPVQPGTLDKSQAKARRMASLALCTGRKQIRSVMFFFEVFRKESLITWLTGFLGLIRLLQVPSLSHEIESDFVEDSSFVRYTIFPSAKLSKCFRISWCKIVEELKDKSSLMDSFYLDIKEADRTISHSDQFRI